VFLHALFAFLVLPGVVALLIPLLIGMRELDAGGTFRPFGLLPLAAGFALLLWCVRDFYVSGKGTLAPWSPPRHLVVTGLYRYSRNPMYISVLVILIGWALTFDVSGLLWYAAFIAVAFQLRVVLGEEPWLARTHGEEWTRYSSAVRRWI